MNRRHVLPFAIAPIAAILLTGNPADAHSRWHSENCDGANLAGQDYQPGYTNTATVNVDGGPAEYSTTFASSFNSGSIPIPQDGQSHTVHYVITTTEPNPPANWTIDLTVTVGPCGEQQTTTTEVATSTSTTTSVPATSSTTPTTLTTSTSTTSTLVSPSSTTTSLPGTTSTAPPSTLPPSSSTSSTPSTTTETSTSTLPTSVPSTTLPPPSSVTTTPPPPDTNPICTPVTLTDGSNSCQTGTLPPTGSTPLVIAGLALLILIAGAAAFGTGRQP